MQIYPRSAPQTGAKSSSLSGPSSTAASPDATSKRNPAVQSFPPGHDTGEAYSPRRHTPLSPVMMVSPQSKPSDSKVETARVHTKSKAPEIKAPEPQEPAAVLTPAALHPAAQCDDKSDSETSHGLLVLDDIYPQDSQPASDSDQSHNEGLYYTPNPTPAPRARFAEPVAHTYDSPESSPQAPEPNYGAESTQAFSQETAAEAHESLPHSDAESDISAKQDTHDLCLPKSHPHNDASEDNNWSGVSNVCMNLMHH